ncbi:MAG: lipase maturation factor family protein [Halioglobus sp.]
MTTLPRALLIYDGDCAFCRYCVDYARSATGGTIEYQPYQAVLHEFPAISEAEFREAIQLVQPDGTVCSGAQAAFQALAIGGYQRFWARCYAILPLFAALSEACYRWVARHRGGCYTVGRLLFGNTLRVASMRITGWLFLRLLALVYLAAFASFALQAQGLIGAQGILPAADFFSAVERSYGPEKYLLLPSLLWLNASDTAINVLGVTGCVLALLLLANVLPRLCLIGLYLCYLSLYHGAQVFMSFQWDILLLECGFLAIFLPSNPVLFSWLYRWLLFRFMLQSGLVKLLSGDPTWRDLTALDFHFTTQPLPTVLAWYVDKLPSLVLQAGVVFTFVVELVLPFLILMPRRPRALAALGIAVFELLIIATGSYNYFNLLTICLCLLLLDDQSVARWCPARILRRADRQPRRRPLRVLPGATAAAYLVLSTILLLSTGSRGALTGGPRQLLSWAEPFHIANSYGLFAVMTTQRNEIVIEGSRDGRQWQAYELPYKPGAVDRAPVWATPAQPRLDWQLWFAALAPRARNPWLQGLVKGLLTGSEPVLGLFAHNPFPGTPPQFIRASLYRYRFSDWEDRARTGAWWTRDYLGEFWPPTAWRLPVEKQTP